MCGIFAAVNTESVTESLISGLSSLSYRGYDSAGIAVLEKGSLERRRAGGKLENLSRLLNDLPIEGKAGIAHTRWATHGCPNEQNAHPHMTSRVAVAHNGIVENYNALRHALETEGYTFESETDSETIAHLITYYLDIGLDKFQALSTALSDIEGSFGIAAIFNDDTEELFAARKDSPLVIGEGENGYYVSSDENALSGKAKSVVHLQDGDIARITCNNYSIFTSRGKRINRELEQVANEEVNCDMNGYDHYMEKEIHEQAKVFEQTWDHYYNDEKGGIELPKLPFSINTIDKLTIIACGTSFFSGLIGKYWLESTARIPVDVDIASEFRYRDAPFSGRGAGLFISQSGETADTLAALNYLQGMGQPAVSLVNVLNSTMAKQSDAYLPTLAGPEIGVASTKAFTSQLTALLILSLALAKENRQLSKLQEAEIITAMDSFPMMIKDYLSDTSGIQYVAASLCDVKSMLYLGRGIAHPLAEEGALKMKEVTYIHAEAYPAGELKHGPLALVDEDLPVVMVVPPDALFSKTLSNLREVASRGGKVILISNREGIEQSRDFICHGIEMPEVHPLLAPILYSLPLQLLAYYTAVLKGNDVDQPRNLAKSVTVE